MAAGVNTRIDDLQMVCLSVVPIKSYSLIFLHLCFSFSQLNIVDCIQTLLYPHAKIRIPNVFQMLSIQCLMCFQTYRYWIKQKTTGRGFYRLLRKPSVCGSSKWGRWRPFITLWTSVTSTLHRNVWLLRSGAPFLTLILFNSLCGGEQWVILIDIHYKWFQPLRCYFSSSIHKWKQWNNLHFTCHDIKNPCLYAKIIEISCVGYLNCASILLFFTMLKL